jgi:hypothetical protein
MISPLLRAHFTYRVQITRTAFTVSETVIMMRSLWKRNTPLPPKTGFFFVSSLRWKTSSVHFAAVLVQDMELNNLRVDECTARQLLQTEQGQRRERGTCDDEWVFYSHEENAFSFEFTKRMISCRSLCQ